METTRGYTGLGPLAYDAIDINIGGGMQSNGTYGFTFSAMTGFGKSETMKYKFRLQEFIQF